MCKMRDPTLEDIIKDKKEQQTELVLSATTNLNINSFKTEIRQ